MHILIRDRTIASDDWRHVAEAGPLPAGKVIVPVKRWQDERTRLLGRSAPVGVRLDSDDDLQGLASDLEHFDVVALEFAGFTDGRGYSRARLLRDRYGYRGELRAVGHIIQDQFLFLERSGFDALEVDDRTDLEGWRQAVAAVDLVYQAAADGRRAIPRLRGGRQRASRACR